MSDSQDIEKGINLPNRRLHMMSASQLIDSAVVAVLNHAEFLSILSTCCETIRLRCSVLKIAVLKDLPLHVHHDVHVVKARILRQSVRKKEAIPPVQNPRPVGPLDAVESKEYLCCKGSESANQNHRPGRCSMIQATNTCVAAYFACKSMLITHDSTTVRREQPLMLHQFQLVTCGYVLSFCRCKLEPYGATENGHVLQGKMIIRFSTKKGHLL